MDTASRNRRSCNAARIRSASPDRRDCRKQPSLDARHYRGNALLKSLCGVVVDAIGCFGTRAKSPLLVTNQYAALTTVSAPSLASSREGVYRKLQPLAPVYRVILQFFIWALATGLVVQNERAAPIRGDINTVY